MEYIPELNNQILLIITASAVIISLLCLIMVFSLSSRMKKFKKAYVSLQTFLSGNDMEKLLQSNLREVKKIVQHMLKHESRLDLIEDKLRNGIDRAEIIRFNSFDNMGADLSFAVALLNQEGTGVILTGIHSIEECRVYAKAVDKGETSAKLNAEEKQAIEKALNTVKI